MGASVAEIRTGDVDELLALRAFQVKSFLNFNSAAPSHLGLVLSRKISS